MGLGIRKVAIYGRVIHEDFYPYFKQMLRDLNDRGVRLACYKPFFEREVSGCGLFSILLRG